MSQVMPPLLKEHEHLVDDFVDPDMRDEALMGLTNLRFLRQWVRVADQISERGDYLLGDTSGVQNQIVSNPDLAVLKSLSNGGSIPVFLKARKLDDPDIIDESVIFGDVSARRYLEKAEKPDFSVSSEAAQTDHGVLDEDLHTLAFSVFVVGRSIDTPIEIEDEHIKKQSEIIRAFWDSTDTRSNRVTNKDLLNSAQNFLEETHGLVNTDGSLIQVARLVNIVHLLETAGVGDVDQGLIFASLIKKKAKSAVNVSYDSIVPVRGLFGRRRRDYIRKKEVFDKVHHEIVEYFAMGVARFNMYRLNTVSQELEVSKLHFTQQGLEELAKFDELISEPSEDESLLLDKLRLDTVRAEIARKMLEMGLGFGDHETKTKLEEFSSRPAHRFILEQADVEVRSIELEKLAEIQGEINKIDDTYKVTSKIIREISSGPRRRKNILDEFVANHDVKLSSQIVDRLLVLADRLVSKDKEVEVGELSKLSEIIQKLQELNVQATDLDTNKQHSKVLEAVNTLEELYEVYGCDGIAAIDQDLAILAVSLYGTNPDEKAEQGHSHVNGNMPDEIPFLPTEETIIFPPKEHEHELIQDFMEELEKQETGESYLRLIEWERIRQLISLRDELNSGERTVSELRIARSTSWSPVPFFVLEAYIGNRTTVIVESPLYGNASYVVHDDEWRDIVSESREDARTLGAIPKVHSTDHEQHRNKLRVAILTR